MYDHCLCMTTLTEVFPCFFLSCKANTRVNPAKTGHGPHSSQFLCCSMYFLCCFMYFCVVLCIVCFVSFSVLFACICVLNYCHRMATQLQLNISYHIITHGHVTSIFKGRFLNLDFLKAVSWFRPLVARLSP